MEAKPSPAHYRAENVVWSISAGTRQGAQEADACMAAEDWLYTAPAPGPPPAVPPPTGSTRPPQTPSR